ncbi:hypothetical protein LJ707_12660 [Mucilaginibacter sp. UR6-1]|uniref:hypothetical protein n=1 Tax=Mucilaginibacter sp. UR6-1 TaxID=1435643 RepID=UPI001E48588A|nr:hypothetical protein [Mucilaginibacter sp. UR6-1]MCC8409783.1 hypothetical protein [Mucilaginibacter sp. UR6-1]
MQLFINDQLVDLADDNAIALTFQINNLGEVKNQQGNTSNQFKLPLTQRNRRILGFPDDVAFNTGELYKRYNAKLVQDGLEVIPYGIAELNSIDNDVVNITILSGNVDFFDALGGKIYEMGDSTSQWSKYGKQLFWQSHDHEWNLHSVISSQQNTEGWIYPVVDYGKLTYNPAGGQHEINVRQLRPGFFVKTAVNMLVSSTGYRASGSLTKDLLYDKLICQFSNSKWEHGTDYQNQPDELSSAVSLASDFSRQHPDIHSNKGTVQFNRVDADKGKQFKNGTTFTAIETMKVEVKFFIPEFIFTGVYKGSPNSTFKFILRVNRKGTEQIVQEMFFDLSADYTITIKALKVGSRIFRNQTLSLEIPLEKNDSLRMDYEFFGDRPSGFTLKQGASLTIKPINQDVQYGQTVQCERILPDLSQKDFLKDILQRFGIICQTNAVERTIVFSSLRDIVKNIPNAKDWTGKCLDQGKQITYQLGNYAQMNYMLFEEDDAIPPKFGQAQIDIQDASLPASAELFKSPFAPSLNTPYIGGPVAQIRMMEQEGDDFSIEVSPRLLVNEIRYISDATPIKFFDGTNEVIVKNDYISTPYFYKEGAEQHLCYADMFDGNTTYPGTKSRYYAELEKVLQQTKKVVRYFTLTPRDVLELDLLIPVYLQQDGAYYYINKIDSWRKGQPTKVELIRL